MLEFATYITAWCLGFYSLFEEGMLLHGIGQRLLAWAARPKEQQRIAALQEHLRNKTPHEEYEARCDEIKHSRTGRQILLKPLFSCVGCMSGLHGIAVLTLVCAVGEDSWAEIPATVWLDGVFAIFLCVFLNRFFWELWERTKTKRHGQLR